MQTDQGSESRPRATCSANSELEAKTPGRPSSYQYQGPHRENVGGVGNQGRHGATESEQRPWHDTTDTSKHIGTTHTLSHKLELASATLYTLTDMKRSPVLVTVHPGTAHATTRESYLIHWV
jgi:hypothetical protein